MMDSVQERLQDIDRELDALGEVPERLPELIARYREAGQGVEEADEALWELQQGLDISEPSAARAERPKVAAAPARAAIETAEPQPEKVDLGMMVETMDPQPRPAELGTMVEEQLDEAETGEPSEEVEQRLEQEEAIAQAEAVDSHAGEQEEAQEEPVLDEVSLFADIEAGEEQQEPELYEEAVRTSQEIDSDFKQVLQLDIDPSVFPPSMPPENRAEEEAPSNAGDATADGSGEAAAAGSDSDEAQPDVDELDEEFLALLDEDVIELEDE